MPASVSQGPIGNARVTMGSENDTCDTRGQDSAAPWDPGAPIQLHAARLRTQYTNAAFSAVSLSNPSDEVDFKGRRPIQRL